MNGDSNLVSPFPSSSAQLGVEIEEEPLPLKAKVGTFTHAGNVVDLCGVSANAGWAEKEGTKLPFGVTFRLASHSLVAVVSMGGSWISLPLLRLLSRGINRRVLMDFGS